MLLSNVFSPSKITIRSNKNDRQLNKTGNKDSVVDCLKEKNWLAVVTMKD